MKLISLSIFLGLALIAGAIHYKPSFTCHTGGCVWSEGDEATFLSKGQITIIDMPTGITRYQYWVKDKKS